MSNSRNSNKLPDRSSIQTPDANKNDYEGLICESTDSVTYAVTVSKKPSLENCDDAPLCAGQKSFISIHSTDLLCQLPDFDNPPNLDECNVEVLSLNEVFPSTSEESLSNEDDSPVQRRKKDYKSKVGKSKNGDMKSAYAPTNSKSSTIPRQKESVDGQPSVYSNIDIPKNTLYVIGSNPGEPKMSYTDPPKKISKTVQEKIYDRHLQLKYTHARIREEICRDLKPYFGRMMKKFLRNIDKHKNEQSKTEKALSKLTTQRGILKDGRCGPECTGDSAQGGDLTAEDLTLPFPMDLNAQANYASYTKQNPDKNVTFNTQVVIIHFSGDLCVGQSVEALSKEKDQQARNSELRKTFLTKYNEFWPTQK